MNSAYRNLLFTDIYIFLYTISNKIIKHIRNIHDDSTKTDYPTIFYGFKNRKKY